MRNIYATLNAGNYASATAVSRSWRNIGRGLAANDETIRARLNWANPAFRQAEDFKKVMLQGLAYVSEDADRRMSVWFKTPIALTQAPRPVKGMHISGPTPLFIRLYMAPSYGSSDIFAAGEIDDIVAAACQQSAAAATVELRSRWGSQQVYPVLTSIDKLNHGGNHRGSYYDPNANLSRSGRILRLTGVNEWCNMHHLPDYHKLGYVNGRLVNRLQRN